MNFLKDCRPFTAGIENATNYLQDYLANLDPKLTSAIQKDNIIEKIDSFITDKIIDANETICQKGLTLFSRTDEEVILVLGAF